jgi:phosphatidate cytidylyltransferase
MSRFVSALILIALLLVVLWHLPPTATVVLVAIAAFAAATEVAGLASALGHAVPKVFVGLAASIVAVAFSASAWPVDVPADLFALTIAALVIAVGAVTLANWAPEPSTIARAAVMFMAPIYVGVPLGIFAWLQLTSGHEVLTWLLAMIAVSDSAQYYSGRAFGRRALAPLVSPKKTVEGLVGGLAVVAVVGFVTGPWALHEVSAPATAAIAVGLALVGVVGDLFESLLKRSAGVKDSSSLIPGHGGVLDRIDSHLFAAPAFYLLMRLL